MTRYPEKKRSIVEFTIKGQGFLTVDATSKEEAEEIAWKEHNSGVEFEDFTWGAEDASAEEA